MKLVDIYKREHARSASDIGTVYLYKDNGASPWWHAYEWSAWLCEFYPSGLADSQKLKPVHRNMKEDEHGVINVGMQIESAKKYLPGAVCEMSEDGMSCKIEVDINGYDMNGTPQDLLKEWKNAIPVKTVAEKQKPSNVYARPSSFSSIMRKILGYQLENRIPEDNILFIRELKNMCSDLI